jgi:hypothetical protein
MLLTNEIIPNIMKIIERNIINPFVTLSNNKVNFLKDSNFPASKYKFISLFFKLKLFMKNINNPKCIKYNDLIKFLLIFKIFIKK